MYVRSIETNNNLCGNVTRSGTHIHLKMMMSIIIVVVMVVVISSIGVVLPQWQQYAMIQWLHRLYRTARGDGKQSEEGEGESDCCVVCQCQVSKGERVRRLRGCKHRFHAECIGAWLKEHNTCPLCRNQVITDHHHLCLCHTTHSHNHNHNHKHKYSLILIHIFQTLSDAFIALLYTTLPTSIRDTFPMVH